MHKPILKFIFVFSAFFFVFHFASAAAKIGVLNKSLNYGLVGYWTFDGKDIVADTAIDRSGNNNNGTLIDGPLKKEGNIGQGLNLDGLNDRVQNIPSNPFEYTGGNITMSAWLKSDASDTTTGNIISKPWNSNGEYNYRLTLNNNDTVTITLTGASAWSVATVETVSSGIWHHMVATVDSGKNVTIFIDGTVSKTAIHNIANWTPSNGDGNTSLLIGCLYPYGSGWSGNTSYCIRGNIDDVRIYNRALTASEVKRLYNMGASKFQAPQTRKLTNGLVGYWTFDGNDVVNGTAYDKSGNGNNGTITKAVNTIGKVGQALKFNGLNSYVKVASSTPIYITSATSLTLSAWIKTATSTNSTIFQRFGNGPSTPYYRMSIGGGSNNNKAGFQVRGMAGGETSLFSTNVMNNNNWRHIVGVRDTVADKLLIYIDGTLNNSTADNSSGDLAIDKIPYIGVHGDGNTINGQYFNGLIDEVRVYNRALSASEVSRLYNMGR